MNLFGRKNPKNGNRSRARRGSDPRMGQNVPPIVPAPEEAPTATPEAHGYTPEEISAIINAAISQAMAQNQTQGTVPAQTGQSAEPAQTGQSAEPAQQGQSAEPAQQGQPAEPAQQGQPAEPAQQGQPAEPAQQGQPADPNTEDYATAEARARAAFDREQDEKVAQLKGQAEEQRRQAEERVNAANEAVDKAKATKEKESDEAKRARDAVKEAKKEARHAKWDAFKAKRAEKKAKKEIDKINKKRQKRKVLIRQPKGGIIVGLQEHWKQIAAVAGAAAVLTGGAFAVKHFIIDADLGNNDNKPGTEQTDPTQTPTGTQADPMTPAQIQDIVDNNLDNLGLEEGYTSEDAVELVKFLNGQESTLSIDQANDMLEDIVTSVVTPAINNALVGEKVYETQGLNIAGLLADDPAYEAIQDMEDYINGSIEKPENLAFHAKNALSDQVHVINLGQTYEGFNMTSSSPAARLVWANLAAGMNGLSGALGEDFTIEIDGVTYAHSEINNGTILQTVINSAKNDYGLDAKTIGQK